MPQELHGESLELVADRQFLGHAHSAVWLDGILTDAAGGPTV
jgi:hypothetical protein